MQFKSLISYSFSSIKCQVSQLHRSEDSDAINWFALVCILLVYKSSMEDFVQSVDFHFKLKNSDHQSILQF